MVPGYTLMEHPLVETEAQLWHSLTSKYVTLCTLHAEWSGPNARLPWLPVFCVARDHAESGPTRNAGTSHQGAQTRPLSGCASTCGSRPSTGRAFRLNTYKCTRTRARRRRPELRAARRRRCRSSWPSPRPYLGRSRLSRPSDATSSPRATPSAPARSRRAAGPPRRTAGPPRGTRSGPDRARATSGKWP
jgi:hypothetical protein